MGSLSKQKGAQYERETCQRLSLWVTDGKRKDVFWRTAMSGGRAVINRRSGTQNSQAGDITSVRPEGHALTDRFVLECKFYQDLNIDGMVFGNDSTVGHMWDCLQVEAAANHKFPLMFARQNRRPDMVLFCYYGWQYIKQANPDLQFQACMPKRDVRFVFLADLLREVMFKDLVKVMPLPERRRVRL